MSPFVLPPPPPDRARVLRVSMYVLAALSGVAIVLGGGVGFLGCALFGALGYSLTVARRREVGAALAMAALDRTARGRYDESRALLDAVPKNVLSSPVGMMVDSQRAALALYEGDLDTAVAEATRGARLGKRLGTNALIQQGSALSIRAVALAGLGRKEEALADVAMLRTARYRQGAFVARAALAEAMLHARERNLDALAIVLREERSLLFGSTTPRERMVARALQRMVVAKKVSIYREPAKRDEQDLDEGASWVARLAPDAAAYARAPKLGVKLEAPAAIDPKVLAGAERHAPKAKRPWTRAAALWVILIVMFLTIWQFLTPAERTHGAPEPPPVEPAHADLTTTLLTVLFTVAFLVGLIAFRIVRARKLTVALGESMELRQRGKLTEAQAAFETLAKNKVPLVAPQAERELASIAIANGDFPAACRHAERGIVATRTSAASLAMTRPVILPQLHGLLAFALAASGDVTRAEEEIARLHTLFPAYPYLAHDTFVARLTGLAAAGRFGEAAAMARDRPADLPLWIHEELLCDALRLEAGDVLPDGERERIAFDLNEEAGVCVDRIAPTLRSRVRVRLHERSDAADEAVVDEGVGEERAALRARALPQA